MGMKPSGRPLWVSEMATHAKATNNGGSGLRTIAVGGSQRRGQADELVDGEHYGGRSTSVLRACDRTGVGGGEQDNEPAMDQPSETVVELVAHSEMLMMNTTWDSMGRVHARARTITHLELRHQQRIHRLLRNLHGRACFGWGHPLVI